MPKKRYNAEEIIHKLREADVLLSQGMNVGQVSKRIGIAEQTYYRWRVHYNTIRPHSSLNYRPPAQETLMPIEGLQKQPKAA